MPASVSITLFSGSYSLIFQISALAYLPWSLKFSLTPPKPLAKMKLLITTLASWNGVRARYIVWKAGIKQESKFIV